MKPSIKATGWLAIAVAGPAGIAAAVGALLTNSPAQIADDCVGALGCAFFLMLGVLLLAITSHHLIRIDTESIERQDILRKRTMRLSDLARVAWRSRGIRGTIVLGDGSSRLKICLDEYSPTDRVALVDYLRDVIPAHVEQTGWSAEFFRRRPCGMSADQLKRLIRFTVIAAITGWLCSIAIAAWSMSLGAGAMPLWGFALKGIGMFGIFPIGIGVFGWIDHLDFKENSSKT